MKKLTFLIAIAFLIAFSSCKKETGLTPYLPTIQGLYVVPDSTNDTYPVVTITDGNKVCELHTLPWGQYVKLISGFARENLGKEMLDEELSMHYFYDVKDSILLYHTFYYLNQWQNWFTRNEKEGLGYSYPTPGLFLLFKDNSSGKFFSEGMSFTTWFPGESVHHTGTETEPGFPTDDGLTFDLLKQGKVFLSVVYFQEKFWSSEKK